MLGEVANAGVFATEFALESLAMAGKPAFGCRGCVQRTRFFRDKAKSVRTGTLL